MQEKVTRGVEKSQEYVVWYLHPTSTNCTNPTTPQKSTTLQGTYSTVLTLAKNAAPRCKTCKHKLIPDLR